MPEFLFAIFATLGVLAAKRPEIFARYFLAESQRERLAGNMGAVSWTGWVIFACSTFTLITLLVNRLLG